jgi:penicillin-binding protein 2
MSGATQKKKFRSLTIGFCCALSIIILRLVYLQVHLNDTLLTQSKKNYLRIEKIACPRGNIVDRNGTLLVTNRPTTDLYWQGSGNRTLNPEQLQTLSLLASIIDKPLVSDTQLLTTIQQAERFHKKVLLSSDVPFEQLSQLEEQFPHDHNIQLMTQFKRFYPYQTFASHLLGYLGHFDMEVCGKMGLEQLMEEQLKGQHGTLVRTTNSLGKNLSTVEIKKPFAGNTIQTTLDINLQTIIENVFPAQESGTAVVMDPEDGGILALVSRPNFDPGLFLDPISAEDWHMLQERQPFLNRAFNTCYPPGSIFKLVSVSAALEQHVISQDTIVNCRGHLTFAGRNYHCARTTGHGELTTCEAVAHSCNILFFEIGKRLDIDLLAEYAHIFGLGEKTNVLFSEKTGLVPCRAWKKSVKKERWWAGETLSAAIGQSFLLVTPIQVARMICSIFTGYLTNPRILINEPIVRKELDIQPGTLSFLRRSMRATVNEGTGQSMRTVKKDTVIYAKTSTAQTSTLSKRDLAKKYMEHGWVVVHLTYKKYKPVVLVILVENIGSSRVATKIARDFIIAYKQLLDGVSAAPKPEEPEATITPPENVETTVAPAVNASHDSQKDQESAMMQADTSVQNVIHSQ